MGHFGLKSYETDWIQDLFDHFNLSFSDTLSQENLNRYIHWIQSKVKPILEFKEAFLGIVIFLIDFHKASLDFIGLDNLRKALWYANDLLESKEYSQMWDNIWTKRSKQLQIEIEAIKTLII